MTTLEGALVTLRPAVRTDITELARIRRTPEVHRHWRGGDDMVAAVEEDLAEPDSTPLVIELEGRVIGWIQWQAEKDPDYRHASMDIYVDPAVHGRGVGTDALRTLARHLIVDQGHHRLTIDPAVDNAAAIRCYTKVGFRPVGVQRKAERGNDGIWHDSLLMDLLADELVEQPSMDEAGAPYYRRDLALVHHLGFGFHADACAPGIIELLRPVRERDGLVVEIGCGSGLLTRHLLDAGHRVVATDASPAMLELAREAAPDAEAVQQLVLPDDPIPAADAIVSVGHALSYLPDEAAIERALVAIADALRPGGVLALDLCDLEWGEARRDAPAAGRVGDDWAIITEYAVPAPNRFVREMAIFVRNDDGSWHRDDERHDNVLIDTARVPGLLAQHGVEARVADSFGSEELPAGLRAVIGRPPAGT